MTLRFNNRIEKKFCQIRLVPNHGDARALALRGEGAVDTLEAPLPPLVAGRYRIEWRVLSTDGHVVSGAFAFGPDSSVRMLIPGLVTFVSTACRPDCPRAGCRGRRASC